MRIIVPEHVDPHPGVVSCLLPPASVPPSLHASMPSAGKSAGSPTGGR